MVRSLFTAFALAHAQGTMMDGGALLKPALSRGELRCIGGWEDLVRRGLHKGSGRRADGFEDHAPTAMLNA